MGTIKPTLSLTHKLSEMSDFLSLLVQIAMLCLLYLFVGGLFRRTREGSESLTAIAEDEAPELPPAGIWDERKAWGRWEDPTERERYKRARDM